MLEIQGLRIAYGKVDAVRGADLSVGAGELVGVIGANGAGKSSTLNAVMGWVKPAGGDVVFEGKELTRTAPEAIVRCGVSLVPEGRQVFTRLTVAENLRLGLSSLPPARRRDAALLDRATAHFPILREFWSRPAGDLSGGQQQQLVIARALVTQPRLLMLDEPSLGLAPKVVAEVFRILDALRHEGITILLVEQNAGATLELADRTYVMTNGLSREIPRGEGLAHEDLVRAYLGDGPGGGA